MKKVLFCSAVFLSFLLESRISFFGIQPDLSAALAFYFGLRNGETKGMLFGSLVGLIGDGLSGGILGPNLLAKGLVGFFASFMSGSVFRWTPLLGLIGISVLTALAGLTVFLSRTFFEHPPTSASRAITIILISAVINSSIGLFVRPRDE